MAFNHFVFCENVFVFYLWFDDLLFALDIALEYMV